MYLLLYNMLRHSVYYKSKNKMYIVSNETYLKNIDEKIYEYLTYDETPSNDNELINLLYSGSLTTNLSDNSMIQQSYLDNINNIISLFQQLQLRFNYECMGKCGSNIVIKDNNSSDSLTLTSKQAHDYYVYLHRFSNTETKLLKLFKIAIKIQKYVYFNYKYNVKN